MSKVDESYSFDTVPNSPIQANPNEIAYPPFEIEMPPEARSGPSFGRRLLSAFKDILETVVPAVIIALLINLFLAQATRVYGQSMEPNLHTDQRLVVEKVSYNFHSPHRGDVVVLRVHEDSEDLLIKRVVALAGQTVEIKDGHVYVDGEMIQENYLSQETFGHYGPIYVPPLNVFVLGDNRAASNDSRAFGPIPTNQIVGRAWFSYWPVEDLGPIK